jgi:hypothetical protein
MRSYKIKESFRFYVFSIIFFIKIKKKFHPYSTAWCELCGLVEALVIGKKVEAQGYIVLAKKK